MRCKIATIAFNCGPEYIRRILEALSGHSIGMYTSKYINQKQLMVKWRKNWRNKNTETKRKVKATYTTDEDYGAVEEISNEELSERKENLVKLLKKANHEIKKLEASTRGQSANPLWKKERCFRLTASNFGRICKRKVNTSPDKLVRSLLYGGFVGNKATKYGLKHEASAIEQFESLTGLKVSECGLFIGKEDEFFLGASPDGVLTSENAILEIKCPERLKDKQIRYSVENKLIDFLSLDKDSGDIKLKKNIIIGIRYRVNYIWPIKSCVIS